MDEIVHIATVSRYVCKLPQQVKSQSRRAYQLFRLNPSHPSLHFKKVREDNGTYSVRIGLGYRALGQLEGPDIVWFWIGPHHEYGRLVRA